VRHLLLAAGLALLLPIAAPAAERQSAKPNFSGTWVIDLSRSDPGPLPAPESLEAVIEHKDPTIISTLTQKSASGVVTSRTTITTDGQENRNTVATETGEDVVTSTCRWNGTELVISATLTLQGVPIRVTEHWNLSEDRARLTVGRSFASDQGSFSQVFVFNRR